MSSVARPERISWDEPQTWYFTFGFAHENAGRYYVVEGVPSDEARARMFETFGRQWAFQYDAHDWYKHGVSLAEVHGLTEVT